MPIIANQANSKVKLVLNAGLDINNKTIFKNKTFANVKAAVQNEDLYNLGVAISDLQEYELANIVRYDEYELLNEI
ncbi:MAG: DUF1659 domain-containing protein [Tissierellia bacterium]|nr:DUF1659 domain-containing protein [Tissierellia bacterium]MDD4439676.1 DUF1659 domain-containing protein [Tissierellia bacterium]